MPTAIDGITSACDQINAANLPYVWGGGHASAGTPSPGYDCSGSVVAALVGGGFWKAGAPVPNDAGVVQTLMVRRQLVGGQGSGTPEVTLFDRPNVHIFMRVNGRLFGTADGRTVPSSAGGGWINDPGFTQPAGFIAYHIPPNLLQNEVSANLLSSQGNPGISRPNTPQDQKADPGCSTLPMLFLLGFWLGRR